MNDISENESLASQENEAKIEKKPIENGRSWLMTFVLIAIVIIVAISAFLEYQLFAEKHSTINSRITKLESNVQKLQSQTSQQNAATLQLDTSLKNLKQELNQRNQFTDLRLALQYVGYQLQMASLELEFNRDPASALVLLQLADEQLAPLNQPENQTELLQLRRSIAEDSLRLKEAVANNYQTNLLLKIVALKKAVAGLPIQGNQSVQGTSSSQSQPLTMQNFWQQSLATIKNLFIIHRNDRQIIPLLAPQQQAILNQNLQLLLEQAQWGVIHRDNFVYKLSLKQALEWLNKYYSANSNKVRTIQQELQSLLRLQVNPPLPKLDYTVQLATQLQKKFSVEAL